MKEPHAVAVKKDFAGAGLLSNGRYQVLITESGEGYSALGDIALTRWSARQIAGPQGAFLYVEDLRTGKLWSATHEPVRTPPDSYESWLGPGCFHVRRTDDGIDLHTETCVAADADVEIRRFTFANGSKDSRQLRVTSYAEALLHHPAADAAHKAFYKLFVQTERIPGSDALLARRRPRSPDEEFPVLLHALVTPNAEPVRVESDRLEFIGRGHSMADPRAIVSGEPLEGSTGSVLDPVLCLQTDLSLEPGEEKVIVLIAAAGSSREAVVELAGRYRGKESITRTLLHAALREQRERDRFKLGPKNADRYHRLAAAVMAGNLGLRASAEVLSRGCADGGLIESLGIHPDRPLLLGRIADDDELAVARLLLKARDFWYAHGFRTEVVLFNDRSGSHADELQERLREVIAASAQGHRGVVLRHADALSDDAQCTLQTRARLVVTGDRLDLLRVKPDEPVSEYVLDVARPTPGHGSNGFGASRGMRRERREGPASGDDDTRIEEGTGAASSKSGEAVSPHEEPSPLRGEAASIGNEVARMRGEATPTGNEVARMRGGPAPTAEEAARIPGDIAPTGGEYAAGAREGAFVDRLASGRSDDSFAMDNGFGAFTKDGREYVIRLLPDEEGRLQFPPLPWVNVIANEQAGFIVSEAGAGYTWHGNSRENRLTPSSNDPVLDPSGEALYLHDEDSGSTWSPTPGPAPSGSPVDVRHGLGYSEFRQVSHALEQRVTMFVPLDAPLKIVRLDVTNLDTRERRLRAGAFARWILGSTDDADRYVITDIDDESGAITAVNPHNPLYTGARAFAVLTGDGDQATSTASCDAFLGRGSLVDPAGMRSDLDGVTGAGLGPCAAFNRVLTLEPEESASVFFALGQIDENEDISARVRRYATDKGATAALEEVRSFWSDLTSRIQVETPSSEIDLLVNGWLPYQNLSCRIWARSAFYQSGGAFGFRDQLQDASAFAATMPGLLRHQILLHAAHQFDDGDVMHWWHPPNSRGIRTRFSDDLLWLPYVTLHYIETSGDRAILDEEVGYLEGPEVPESEDEIFLEPSPSDLVESLYRHCCRAIDRSLTKGAHGFPLIGSGDWNDGMNRIGRDGRGESVWLAFFLIDILRRFIPICEARSEMERAETYQTYVDDVSVALEEEGWDGEWYRRGFYDDGGVIGSAQNDECRIDALVQAWAVLSGAAPREKAEKALDATEEHLISQQDGIIRLFTPPFDRTEKDPGYIKAYVPGVRENGGQYTHAALWVIRALAEAGRCDRAAPLLAMLSPVSHAGTREEAETYKVEPYVVAADVYGAPPHVGRGGWTWYTGSAGWMHRVAVESVLGFRVVDGSFIEIDPCVPGDWERYRLHYRHPGTETEYDVEVTGTPTSGARRRVRTIDVNGMAVEPQDGKARISIADDGRHYRVEIRIEA